VRLALWPADHLLPSGFRDHGTRQFLSDAATAPELFDILPAATPPAALPAGGFALLGTQLPRIAGQAVAALAGQAALLDWLRGPGRLLLCGAGEGREFLPRDARALHQALRGIGLPAPRVAMIQQNPLFAEDYAAWAARAGEAPIHLFSWHHHLHRMILGFARLWADPARRQERLDGIAALRGGSCERRFACLVNRPRPHRRVLLGRIARRGWLAEGLVSCLADTPERDTAGREAGPGWEADLAAFATLPLPMRLEGDTGQTVFDDHWPIYRRAALALVAESEMTVRNARSTEKVFKPLLCGRPVLLAGNPGQVAALRGLGFASFAPVLDEAYDGIEDPAARLDALLETFARLMALDAAEFARRMGGLAEAAEHNLRHAGEAMPVRQRVALAGLAGSLAGLWRG